MTAFLHVLGEPWRTAMLQAFELPSRQLKLALRLRIALHALGNCTGFYGAFLDEGFDSEKALSTTPANPKTFTATTAPTTT